MKNARIITTIESGEDQPKAIAEESFVARPSVRGLSPEASLSCSNFLLGNDGFNIHASLTDWGGIRIEISKNECLIAEYQEKPLTVRRVSGFFFRNVDILGFITWSECEKNEVNSTRQNSGNPPQ